MTNEELELRTRDEWGMNVSELDAIIQTPLDHFSSRVTRWKDLPRPEFRASDAEYAQASGTIETLEHEAYIHPPSTLPMNGHPHCDHVAGAPYVVDPHHPSRVEVFLDLWRPKQPA